MAASQIESVPIESLRLDPANPRRMSRHDAEALKRSLSEYGPVEPAVVNKDGTIIGGHMRVQAAQELGWREFPIVRVDLPEDKARLLNLALNRISGEWDEEKLAEMVYELQEGEAPIELSGFDEDELESLLAQVSGDHPLPADDAPSLADRFLVPPFSVLDGRAGYWKLRERAWISLGIQSELGRGENLLGMSDQVRSGYGGGGGGTTNTNKQKGKGLLYPPSAQDPDFYRKKQEVERRLGREISAGEFEREHWKGYEGDGSSISATGTSIFSAVICELVYRWFCPPGGLVLDPFAGGSVRGVVAGVLGRRYLGIELQERQVDANEAQAELIFKEAAEQGISDPEALTPCEKRGEMWAKRDDLFVVGGARGGKARAILSIAEGAEGLIGVGARTSPQIARVARVAAHLSLPCRVHTGDGGATAETEAADIAGACVRRHKPGRIVVINARAREDAEESGWALVPFGGEAPETIETTRRQVANLPEGISRIVVPVGSGMTLAGILQGLADEDRSVPILGVRVGADPTARLDEYAPEGWRDRVEMIEASEPFEQRVEADLDGLVLDGLYEAKCRRHLQAGDLLWIVGIGDEARVGASEARPAWIAGDSSQLGELAPKASADLIFTCPPYYDLEVYSDDPRDLSQAPSWEEFCRRYREIIAGAVDRLQEDRFAAVVVGDLREKHRQLSLVSETIAAFEEAGASYYNQAIYVTPAGSSAIRAARMFVPSRKLVRTHQHLLVFCKGDPVRATEECGEVVIDDALEAAAEREEQDALAEAAP